jgi:ribosomal protein L29
MSTEFEKKNDEQLAKTLVDKREDVRQFRFGTAGASTRDVRKVRTAKRDIARILTEQNRRRKLS